MQCETFLFGRVDIAPESVIEFPRGLPGFEGNHRFALIHESGAGESPTSFTLQSLDDAAVALQIADPTGFGLHYEMDLSDDEAAVLRSADPGDIALMLVLYKQEDAGAAIRANMQAPLLINTRARIGLQKVMPKIEPRVTLKGLSTAA
jgi:flagellar assembly factor FliW